ncbi:MAG: hypothetical protein ACI9LG_000170 [Moritella dasanensis]|jgi:hypothetical protein
MSRKSVNLSLIVTPMDKMYLLEGAVISDDRGIMIAVDYFKFKTLN